MSQLARVLQLRLDYAQSATKKYNAIAQREHEGRMFDTMQAWGASRTGRWAGRGLQIQNLKRPTLKDPESAAQLVCDDPEAFRMLYTLEDLGSLVRSAIRAPEGYRLVVSDLSSIESRVLGWLTGCRWINGVFAEGKDTYRAFAQLWLGIPYDQVDKKTRNLCKPPFLGFGYGIGAVGLKKYAESMGVEMTDAQCEGAIKAARRRCPEVTGFWRRLEGAFNLVLSTGEPIEVGPLLLAREGRFLTIRLPSGRKLFYDNPRRDQATEQLCYDGQNQYTGKWETITTWGGKLIENVVQAIARDILLEGMKRYTRLGGSIIAHVHDEIIALEKEGKADEFLSQMNRCLSDPIDCLLGLLLGSSGYVSRLYRKDQ